MRCVWSVTVNLRASLLPLSHVSAGELHMLILEHLEWEGDTKSLLLNFSWS